MPPAQPRGKYLFEVVGRMSSPCIKFHFQISNLTSPAPNDESAGISVSFLHHMGGWEWTKGNMMAGRLVSLSQNGRPATCFCPTENLPFSFTTSHVACGGECHQPNPTASTSSKWLEGCRILASNFIFKFQISPALHQMMNQLGFPSAFSTPLHLR